MVLTDGLRQLLERDWAFFGRLDDRQRAKLVADASTFGQKEFVGFDGFAITDRVRAHVSATAALLVLGLDIARFAHVQRIEIREARYLDDHGNIAEGHYEYATRETGPIGILHLAWRGLLDGETRPDGMHVGIHELAHALDHGLGERLLAQHERCDIWRDALRDFPLHKGLVVADVDGPELFAVASELFFERPMSLMRVDPALFFELVGIYQLDPRRFG